VHSNYGVKELMEMYQQLLAQIFLKVLHLQVCQKYPLGILVPQQQVHRGHQKHQLVLYEVWGQELQDAIHTKLTESKVLTFEVFNDWLPTDECFVSVDKTAKDKFGMPLGVINLWGHPQDLEVGEHLAQKAVKVLKEMGAKEISYNISAAPPPNLVAGGCRFGVDTKNSVLDKNCKAHELDNLYVTDASFMPTGGSVPYTWTIYANSFRVAIGSSLSKS